MGAGASALAPGVEQWTADQVGDFVGAFGAEYAQYKAAFVEKGINGKTLLTLDDGDLGEARVAQVWGRHESEAASESKKRIGSTTSSTCHPVPW